MRMQTKIHTANRLGKRKFLFWCFVYDGGTDERLGFIIIFIFLFFVLLFFICCCCFFLRHGKVQSEAVCFLFCFVWVLTSITEYEEIFDLLCLLLIVFIFSCYFCVLRNVDEMSWD
eukprot:PhF_6_TR19444/c1_g1_i1/m.28434